MSLTVSLLVTRTYLILQQLICSVQTVNQYIVISNKLHCPKREENFMNWKCNDMGKNYVIGKNEGP